MKHFFALLFVLLYSAVVVFATQTQPVLSCPACSSGVNSECYTCADCSISIYNGNCQCGDGSACQSIDSSCCYGGAGTVKQQIHPVRTAMVPAGRHLDSLLLGCFLCSGTCCNGQCYSSGSSCCTSGGSCPSQAPICCLPPPGSSTGGCCPAGTICGPNFTCLNGVKN